MALHGADTPPTTPENPAREAEAFLRIANVIAAELPSITTDHWHDALRQVQGCLVRTARMRAPMALRPKG